MIFSGGLVPFDELKAGVVSRRNQAFRKGLSENRRHKNLYQNNCHVARQSRASGHLAHRADVAAPFRRRTTGRYGLRGFGFGTRFRFSLYALACTTERSLGVG
jgi:hypothetical protein